MTNENTQQSAEQTTDTQTQGNSLMTDEQAMDKFQGFATRDGERIEPTPKEPDAPAPKGGEQKAKGGDQEKDKKPEGGDDADNEQHKSAQKRINQAIGRQRAAERRADNLEAQLSQMTQRLTALEQGGQQQQQQNGKPKTDPNAPQPADYEYGELDAAYIRDLARYEARKEFETQTTNSQKQQRTASEQEAQQAKNQRLDAFYTKGLDIADDFEEVISDDGLKISSTLGELAMESEHGPQIIYAMASNPKEAKSVSAMSPARQAAWFGTKEAELSSESSDAEEHSGQQTPQSSTSPKTTQAPPPPKGKTRGSGETQQVSPATTDFKQFERLAMKKQD